MTGCCSGASLNNLNTRRHGYEKCRLAVTFEVRSGIERYHSLSRNGITCSNGIYQQPVTLTILPDAIGCDVASALAGIASCSNNLIDHTILIGYKSRIGGGS